MGLAALALFCLERGPAGTVAAQSGPAGAARSSSVSAPPFLAGELLGRPTDHSVTVRALGAQPLDVSVEWGTGPGLYTSTTPAVRFAAGSPIELVMEGLRADTTYFYRLRYRTDGATVFRAGEERRFHTARPPGQPFTFVVQADPHLDEKPTQATDDDMWRWTLGEAQYRWLRQTLEASHARFKLVFSHHQVGSSTPEVRGGAATARLFEWGGRNLDGSWGFDARRPGWGKPIHQLMVDTGVNIWFHGHDHVYVAEELDGVVYQEVPQPSLARYDSVGSAAEYGYIGTPGVNIFGSSGHLRVSVSSSGLRVEYVRSVPPQDETGSRRNGVVLHSYVVPR